MPDAAKSIDIQGTEFLKLIGIIRNADASFVNSEMLFQDYESYPMHELVNGYLARIEAYDQKNTELNAIIRINHKALVRAKALVLERKKSGPPSPLHGIPVILKDNYNTRDMPTSGGSAALAGFIPPRDAFQVKKLREAGAIILAKANMDEIALGSSGMIPVGGQTRSPYDPRRSPGGSSGDRRQFSRGGYGHRHLKFYPLALLLQQFGGLSAQQGYIEYRRDHPLQPRQGCCRPIGEIGD